MGAQYAIKAAKDLAVGDIVRVWWGRGAATVSGFRSHTSKREGWTVADFGDGHSMTITPLMLLAVKEINDE